MTELLMKMPNAKVQISNQIQSSNIKNLKFGI